MPPLDMLKIIFKTSFSINCTSRTALPSRIRSRRTHIAAKFYHMASGQMDIGLMPEKPADADLLSDLPDPEQMGAWMSDADLDFYVNEFSRNGFRVP
ncbi:MAG: hypothetical protein CM15mP120_20560 [Pseudomonadota bacterium]|nr:MAG: hypothetical protein CM15mP120_20560 [Pseudomonadota bacterium]